MSKPTSEPTREPWMRGTHAELDALRRGVLHALEHAEEDLERWVAPLSQQACFARPLGLPSVAFHLRHMARSLDRLLTYAEDRMLDEHQLAQLGTEMHPGTLAEVLQEARQGLQRARQRVVAFQPLEYELKRGIGRQRLPTTVGGLLVHCAEHTQRHAGQMVTTAKIVQQEESQRA
ncbi:MAG: DinB family protein [Acidobacteriaceae bacterium]|nr:DinB family protein [Acidobacteriaceae bacterium]